MWFDVDLRGDVVHLRPFSAGDASAVLSAALEDQSSYSYTWVPSTTQEADDYVTTVLEEFAARESIPLVVETIADGRVVGSSRFMDLDYLVDRRPGAMNSTVGPPRAVEIGGTWYAASVQRTAVNTECKLLMLSHAFDTWRVERVCFRTDARNARSRAAIERLGPSFEGVRRAHMTGADGAIRDSAYYSIVAAEWPQCRRRLQRLLARS